MTMQADCDQGRFNRELIRPHRFYQYDDYRRVPSQFWPYSKYFSPIEMRLDRGDEIIFDSQFLGNLYDLREDVGRPFIPTSYGRTKQHNAKIGGHPKSAHMAARGIDIKAHDSAFVWEVAMKAPRYGFHGIGIRMHGDSPYIHLDDVPRQGVDGMLWTYA